MGPRRPPMRAALRRCRKGRMTGSDWREPVRTHVSLGTSMPKITGILKYIHPSVAPVECGKPAAKRRVFHTERFKARSGRAAVGNPRTKWSGMGQARRGFPWPPVDLWDGVEPPPSPPPAPPPPPGAPAGGGGGGGRETPPPRAGARRAPPSLREKWLGGGRAAGGARGAPRGAPPPFFPPSLRSVRGKSLKKGWRIPFSFKITPRRPAGPVPRRVKAKLFRQAEAGLYDPAF